MSNELIVIKRALCLWFYFLENSLFLLWKGLGLGVIIVLNAHAQLVTVPVGPVLPKPAPNAKTTTKLLKLPFFDDFSANKTIFPDTSRWELGGGTYVSNTITIDHPTRNVVVLDGTNINGLPYEINSPSAEGITDILTSQPIDLSGLAAKDLVYISFFWRGKGLGEIPDQNDTLRLQFKNLQGDWKNTRFVKSGKDVVNKFQFADSLHINDAAYLYKGFQFRFLAKGRLSGQYDNWFIDYVYLNRRIEADDKREKPTKAFYQDVATVTPISPFLKRYSAMPVSQYLVRPELETADSLTALMSNLNNAPNPLATRFTIIDELTKKVIQQANPFGKDSTQFINETSSQLRKIKLLPLQIAAGTKKVSLLTNYFIRTTDDSPTKKQIKDIDLTVNDTISSRTTMDSTYAYDDGSAEYVAYMNKPLGRTAVRFVLNKPDKIGGVKMNLSPILKDISGQGFTLMVWDSRNGKPDKALFQRSYKIKYPTNRDGFVDFPFLQGDSAISVAVKDTFYVGWIQTSTDFMTIGLDKNNSRAENIFVNTGVEWASYKNTGGDLPAFEGNLMLRPYLGSARVPIVLSTSKEEKTEDDWVIYPNPTNGIVRWNSDEVKEVQVFSVGGNTMISFPQPGSRQVNISNLPTGKYLIRLSNDNRSVIHKILKL